MKKLNALLTLVLFLCLNIYGQFIPSGATVVPGDVNINGNLDNLDEFSTLYTIPIEMPDGIKLMTDIYLPVTQDSMSVDVPDLGRITLIPRGTQLFYYDSITTPTGKIVNPDPYSLPMILTRTPYDKTGDLTGRIITIFGYAYTMSDMRGRYSSEGVYFPMMSDSWNKNPYHNHFTHILDANNTRDPETNLFIDPRNANRHEDGYWTVQNLVHKVKRAYDIDNDGVLDTFNVCNGSLGTFGASALGNTQYQEAGAHKIDPMGPGMKGMLPIVATLEHYRYTGYQNGVFRERIVTGWLKGQIFDVEDDLIDVDYDRQNNIHTSKDYDLPKPIEVNLKTKTYQPNQFDASALAIDHFVRMRYQRRDGTIGLPGYYPNSEGRGDMDGSHALVDINGEAVMRGKIVSGRVVDVDDSDPEGIIGFGNSPRPTLVDDDPTNDYSRYRNMDVPCYHLTGWWDIFTDGQIETWRLMKEELQKIGSKNANLQKIVIGPWVHQTIGGTKTGDMLYKENVTDILGFAIGDVDIEDLAIEDVLSSEIVSWFRYSLNYNDYKNIGLPKVRLPESRIWQELAGGLRVRVPSENYEIQFLDLINFINGTGDLTGLPYEIELFPGAPPIEQTIDIPPLNEPVIKELDGKEISAAVDSIDFSKVANFRFYVIGPNGDGWPQNDTVGNYWFHSDTFPIENNINWKTMYMHQNGKLNYSSPTEDEGFTMYVHDPDDQVYTLGGANMIVKLPDGYHSTVQNSSNSQGQINLADPRWKHRTMDRNGVVSFETDVLTDTLCIIGFPEAKLYAKSSPGGEIKGPTDTDFFVRILDVYPPSPQYPYGREFFVVEGCVNARARDYAKALVEAKGLETKEIDNIPFTNINIGQIYEYYFRLMPIAYTWGVGHKMKILISSSNHTRYQVNPNIPLNDGDFFRRQPLDGQTYKFNDPEKGEIEMEPRVAVQRIAHSPEHPTSIILPVYDKTYTNIREVLAQSGSDLRTLVYPNPATEEFNVYVSKPNENYDLVMFNEIGQEVYKTKFTDELKLDATRFDKGIYLVQVRDVKTKDTYTTKVTIQ